MMRKFLLSTTAIVGIISYSGHSFADVEVKLGGFNELQFGLWDNDREDQTGREFRNHTEIHLDVNGTADFGFRYGIDVEIISRGSSGISFDENHIFIAHKEFGQVQLGDEDGANDTLAIHAPVKAGTGHIDGDYNFFIGGFATGSPDIVKTFDSDDETKVTYYTPKFYHDPHAPAKYGLQAGISYTPEFNRGIIVRTQDTADRDTDFIEFGVNYVDNFDGIDVLVGFTGSTFEENNEFATDDDGMVINDGDNERFFSWQAGVQATYLGITVGGAYVDYDEVRGLTDAFHVGAEYTNGPLTFGGAYARVQAENSARNESVGNLYGVAMTYKVAPGVSVLADLMFLSTDVDNLNSNAVFGTATVNGRRQEIDFTVLAIFGVKVAF